VLLKSDKRQNAPKVVDLTRTHCPMTYVRAMPAMEKVAQEQLIELVLMTPEQIRDIPPALKAEGHRIESVLRDRDRYHLLVRKGA
jgi:TusA-related sulfurtransferase